MSGTAAVAPVPVASSAPGFMIYVVCAPWVLALPGEPVERLLLPEEAQLDEDPSPERPAALGVLRADHAAYSAWDLGLLLGLAPQSEAWVLLRLHATRGPLPLALRTGHCLSAAPLPASLLSPLPKALFRARAGLVVGAFSTAGLGPAGRQAAVIGLALDLGRLWSDEETAHAEAALRAAGTDEA